MNHSLAVHIKGATMLTYGSIKRHMGIMHVPNEFTTVSQYIALGRGYINFSTLYVGLTSMPIMAYERQKLA